MQFRKATIFDIPTIQAIAEETWRPTYHHILTEEQTIYMLDLMYRFDVLQKQIEGNVSFYLVEEEGVTMGYVGFEAISEELVKLHKIYFRPHQKKKGAGRFTMDFVKEQSKLMGAQFIELNVNKYNSAVDFYLKMGFTISQEMELDIGRGYIMDDFVMQFDLRLIE
jgi:N-acetylglutamate synthase-like GNAT family acetyltransferase